MPSNLSALVYRVTVDVLMAAMRVALVVPEVSGANSPVLDLLPPFLRQVKGVSRAAARSYALALGICCLFLPLFRGS